MRVQCAVKHLSNLLHNAVSVVPRCDACVPDEFGPVSFCAKFHCDAGHIDGDHHTELDIRTVFVLLLATAAGAYLILIFHYIFGKKYRTVAIWRQIIN